MGIAVITGASSGMGMEFAKQICLNNPKGEVFDELWLIARRRDRLEELARSLPVPCRVFSLDLTKEESLDEFRKALDEAKPEVSLLLNASGYGKFFSTMDTSPEDVNGMIDLNCKALVRMTQLTVPYMAKGSHIVELDSLSAFQPVPYLNVYAASKAFVLSFTRALGAELRHTGIHVMAVCPGWVKTEFFDRAEPGGRTEITYFNKLFTAEYIVKTAIRDMYREKKDVCVPDFSIKAQVLLTKLLPHRLVMKIWLKQQGKK